MRRPVAVLLGHSFLFLPSLSPTLFSIILSLVDSDSMIIKIVTSILLLPSTADSTCQPQVYRLVYLRLRLRLRYSPNSFLLVHPGRIIQVQGNLCLSYLWSAAPVRGIFKRTHHHPIGSGEGMVAL